MDLKTPLLDQRKAALTTARAMLDTAKAADRDLTDSERDAVEGLLEQVKSIDVKIKQQETFGRVLGLGAGGYDTDPDDDSPGRGVFDAAGKSGIVRAVKTRTSFRTEAQVPWAAKAAILDGGLLTPPVPGKVQGGLYPTGVFPLASLFPQAPADGPVVRVYRTSTATAGIVAEGGLKPDAGLAVTPADLALVKIATTTQVSDELEADAPILVANLQRELTSAVATSENEYILATFGATSGVLTGTGTAATVIDAVADAIATQEAFSGLTPTAVIAAPSVIASIRKGKASTAGSYFVDPTAPGPSSLHGVALISSPAVDATTVWVVEATGVVIYRRGPLTVDVGLSGDDFVRNLTHLRAEERVGTAVVRPSSLVKVTLTA